MTNHKLLYAQAQTKLVILPTGEFRFSDICDNPPAGLGHVFRDDVVVNKRYPNIRRVGADEHSVIYEKLWM